jgi:membrane protein implicated in regulation of membrane protease activity
MSEARSNLGPGVFALVPIGCCIGLPLIAAAGVSVGLGAWVAGILLAALVLIAAAALFVLRARHHRTETRSSSILRTYS